MTPPSVGWVGLRLTCAISLGGCHFSEGIINWSKTEGLLYWEHHTESFLFQIFLLLFPFFFTVKFMTLELNLLSDLSIIRVPFVVVSNYLNLSVSYICPKQLLHL